MNVDEFWKIIEATLSRVHERPADGNMDKQAEDLRLALSKLSLSEMNAFGSQFSRLMDDAYTWDLWGAAYIIGTGCSDDSFVDFRRWLISMGRITYESAIADPESLIGSLDNPSVEDFFFEEFCVQESNLHEAKPSGPIFSSVPRGKPWKNDTELKERLPRLWSKLNPQDTSSDKPWWKHSWNSKVENHRKKAYQFCRDVEDNSKDLTYLIQAAKDLDPAIIFLLAKFKKSKTPDWSGSKTIRKILEADTTLREQVESCSSDSYIDAFLSVHGDFKDFSSEKDFLCVLTESLES